MRVLVLGAGITGLATAWNLLRHEGAEALGLDVRVVEAEDSPGGKIRSIRDEGWVFETGPAGFLDNEDATMRMVRGLDIESELLRSNDAARRRFVRRRGRFQELQMHPLRFMTSPLLSLRGRLRVVAEFWQKARTEQGEESVGSFGRRRLGKEFAEVLLDAMVTGIHAADMDRLSLQAAFPKVADLERRHGGLLKGMRALKKERRGKVDAGPGGALHTFREGMGTPLEALAREVGEARLILGSPVTRVERRGPEGGWVVQHGRGQEEADILVSALPAHAAAQVFQGVSPVLGEALGEIPFAGVHVVCTGHRREDVQHPLEGFGALIPAIEGSSILGSIWSSSTFDGQAPAGCVQLRTLVGGARDPAAGDLSRDELVDRVMGEIVPAYGIRGEPLRVEVFRWTRGIPQYELGHVAHVAHVRAEATRLTRLHLTGNSVCGVSFNHCIADAERIAESVIGEARSIKERP